MFCNHCGAQLPDEAKFCNLCGNRIGEIISEFADSEQPVQTETAPEQIIQTEAVEEAVVQAETIAEDTILPETAVQQEVPVQPEVTVQQETAVQPEAAAQQTQMPASHKNNKGLIIAISASAAAVVCVLIVGIIILANIKSNPIETTEKSSVTEEYDTPAVTTTTAATTVTTTTPETTHIPTQEEIEASVAKTLTSKLKGTSYPNAVDYINSNPDIFTENGITATDIYYDTGDNTTMSNKNDWNVNYVDIDEKGIILHVALNEKVANEKAISESLTNMLKGAKYNQALQYLAQYGIPEWKISYVTDEGGKVLAPSNWNVTSVEYKETGTTVYLTRGGYIADSLEDSIVGGALDGVQIGIAGSIADLFW